MQNHKDNCMMVNLVVTNCT